MQRKADAIQHRRGRADTQLQPPLCGQSRFASGVATTLKRRRSPPRRTAASRPEPARASPNGNGMPSATDTGATATTTSAARSQPYGQSSVASMRRQQPGIAAATHQATTMAEAMADPALPRSAPPAGCPGRRTPASSSAPGRRRRCGRSGRQARPLDHRDLDEQEAEAERGEIDHRADASRGPAARRRLRASTGTSSTSSGDDQRPAPAPPNSPIARSPAAAGFPADFRIVPRWDRRSTS